MDVFNDLLGEIENARNGKKSMYIEELLEAILINSSSDFSEIEKKYHCTVDETIEKHHQLQFTHYFTIFSDLIGNGKADINLTVENGINNGTQLNEYSFTSSTIPKSRTAEILVDLELDEDFYNENPEFSKMKAEMILFSRKREIMSMMNKQNYDNYVTGGGTNVTDKSYSDFHNKYRTIGLVYKPVYKEIEVDLNIVLK